MGARSGVVYGLSGAHCPSCGKKLKRHPVHYSARYCVHCDNLPEDLTNPPDQIPGQVRMTPEDIRYAEWCLVPRPRRERVPFAPARADCESCGAKDGVHPWWAYWIWMGACHVCGTIADCPPVIRWRDAEGERDQDNGSSESPRRSEAGTGGGPR